MSGNYRIYNKSGHYQQVTGKYPDQKVLKDFPDFTSVLAFTLPRGHFEEGSFNFLQFIIGTIRAEGITDNELLSECSSSAASDVYKKRAVRMLDNFVNSGRGWQTYLDDKND